MLRSDARRSAGDELAEDFDLGIADVRWAIAYENARQAS